MFNCGRLNNSTKFCTNSTKCLACGSDKHNEANLYLNALYCINCKGNHRSLSRECSEIIVKKKTTKLMTLQNVNYNIA